MKVMIESIRIDEDLMEDLSAVVEQGAFDSRSEAIREAIEDSYEEFSERYENIDERDDLDVDVLYAAALESYSLASVLAEELEGEEAERYQTLEENAFQHLIGRFPQRDFTRIYLSEKTER